MKIISYFVFNYLFYIIFIGFFSLFFTSVYCQDSSSIKAKVNNPLLTDIDDNGFKNNTNVNLNINTDKKNKDNNKNDININKQSRPTLYIQKDNSEILPIDLDQVIKKYTLAKNFYSLGRWQLSFDALYPIALNAKYDKKLASTIDLASLYSKLGNLYFYNGRSVEAIVSYVKAESYMINNQDLMMNLENVLKTMKLQLVMGSSDYLQKYSYRFYYILAFLISIVFIFSILIWFVLVRRAKKGRFLMMIKTICLLSLLLLCFFCYRYYVKFSFYNAKFAVSAVSTKIYSSGDNSKVVLDYISAGSIVRINSYDNIDSIDNADEQKLVKVDIFTERSEDYNYDKDHQIINSDNALKNIKSSVVQLSGGWVDIKDLISWDL